ncbi:MAG: PAS domain S-box protein, partial [Syntrophaceae bacterium]|nr:PAS domain S-box protein [Syntrophaceae bacterium]
MGTVQNIQQYAMMRDALWESEEVYNKLLATIPDPVFRADVQGRIMFVNDVALRISGYAKEELIGKNLLSFLVPEDRPRVEADLRLMFKKSLGPIEYRMIDR